MTAPPGLLILDCDGVLVDSEMIARRIEAELLAEAGFPLSAEEFGARFTGRSVGTVRREIEAQFGRPLPPGHERLRSERLHAAFAAELRPMPGVEALLDGLRIDFCVASGSPDDRLAHSLAVVGLAGRFGGRAFSVSAVGRGKPAPDLFLLAASAFGVDPERCLVVEDTATGIQAAVAAGMEPIGFVGGSHCGPDHAAILRGAGARAVLPDHRSLARHLAALGAWCGQREAALP
ncbi:MAG TPA: HAD family hydrolase [Alphaproteobacteria bacterium]|nr:HAD family hydrolase [Alphaproteobacteria bacterium]